MCTNFKRRQDKRTTSVPPLSCVFCVVSSMLLYKLLFSQLKSLTCYLMPVKTEQFHFCMCNTWIWKQSRVFSSILFFIISSWGGAGLGGRHVLSSWAREGSHDPACSVCRSSAVTSLRATVWLGWDRTALWDGGWHASCHRRRSRGGVWQQPAPCLCPKRKEVAEDVPWAERGSGCPWAGWLLLTGSSSVSYLWQAHRNLACFLLAGWFFMHLVSRKELA